MGYYSHGRKSATTILQDQVQRQLKKGRKFEDLSARECRPSALVERYDNLYTQWRLDAMDELIALFSVLVVGTIIFICIYSSDSFKKVVIIYLKWEKRPVRTPKESAWGNFFREKATFCEDERLVGQMISVPQLRVTDASRSAKRHLRLWKKSLRWPRDL